LLVTAAFFSTFHPLRTMSIHVISSMATKAILGALCAQFTAETGIAVRVESTGGVDAAKRVRAGEAIDVVFLAKNVIEAMQAEGVTATGSARHCYLSGVVVAVAEGSVPPDISSEEAVKQAVLRAKGVGYSTGPSGVAIAKLFERWGIADQMKGKVIVAPPGVPVADFLARGEVDIGFQQLAEMMGMPGVSIVGVLPPAIAIDTVFSGAVATASARATAADQLLTWLAAPARAQAVREQGMQLV
jgi:molybdate transport system substrate-binding protein